MALVETTLTKPMGIVFEDNDTRLGGIYVAEVGDGSAAQAAGTIATDDQLVAVDGVSTRGMGFDDAMELLIAGGESGVRLQFARDEDPVLLHNPRAFFDIEIGGAAAGRIEMCLRADVVPETAHNFEVLCKGTLGTTKRYKGSTFHRVIPGFMCQGGDFERGDGTGGSAVCGRYFPDENFALAHEGVGTLSMANAGRNTNGSQFFLCVGETPFLDGKHVVFGKVVGQGGLDVLRAIEAVGSPSGRPSARVVIADAGVL